jgi:hypothetical protein
MPTNRVRRQNGLVAILAFQIHKLPSQPSLSISVNYFTLGLYQTYLPLPPDQDRIIFIER